jgi:hypothetical protein
VSYGSCRRSLCHLVIRHGLSLQCLIQFTDWRSRRVSHQLLRGSSCCHTIHVEFMNTSSSVYIYCIQSRRRIYFIAYQSIGHGCRLERIMGPWIGWSTCMVCWLGNHHHFWKICIIRFIRKVLRLMSCSNHVGSVISLIAFE